MNPAAEATVVSLLPFPIHEEKPGLHPGVFDIPAAAPGDFSILHIGVSNYGHYVDGDRGTLSIPEFASNVAKAIVNDYANSQLEADANHKPGLFWVAGKLDKEKIKTLHAKELAAAQEVQNKWFKKLVMRASDSWTKHKLHRNITELERHAARALKVEAEWAI